MSTKHLQQGLSQPGTAAFGLAQYIGRVGGLAVALGIGVAIANNAGVAMATTGETGSGAGSSTTSSSSSSTAGSESTSSANSSTSNTNTPSNSSGQSSTTTTTSTSTTLGTVQAAGGANTTVSSGSPSTTRIVKSRLSSIIASFDDNNLIASRTETAKTTATTSRSTKNSTSAPAELVSSAQAAITPPRQSSTVSTTVTNIRQYVSTTVSSASKALNTSQTTLSSITPPSLSPVVTRNLSAATSSSAASARTLSTAIVSMARATPTVSAPLAPVARVVTQVFNTLMGGIGIDPTATNNPVAPPQGPTFFAALDYIRRELEYTFFNKGPALSYDPSKNTQLLYGITTGQVTAAGVKTSASGQPVLTDASGDPLTLTYTQPAHGTVNVNQDGTFTYIPNPDFAVSGGTDTFTVTADDRPGNPAHINLLALNKPDNGATTTQVVTVTVKPTSPLATADELAAERRALQILADPAIQNALFVDVPATATTPAVLSLRTNLLNTANGKIPGGVDSQNLALLNEAVTEFGMAAALQSQAADPTNPKVVEYLVPPHTWYDQTVPGSRLVFDNPDTLYRTIPVSAASTYVIHGQLFGPKEDWPTDINFSVNTNYGGTSANINKDDLVVNADGTFDIYVGNGANPDPVNHPNYLTLTVPANPATPGVAANGILVRDTLGDWNSEIPMALSVERLSGPTANPAPTDAQLVATTIASISRGSLAYNAFITRATATPPNTFAPIATGGSQTLTTQLQTYGNFKLANDEALVITITPNRAGYFSVPVTNDWTITDVDPNVAADYGAEQISLNNKQALPNADGTYTFVVSPTDPGVANWVSTGGLNQGTINLRFQDLDPNNQTNPTYTAQVVQLSDLNTVLPADTVYYTPAQRAAQLAEREAGYNNRFAPYPQV
jgi:Bacterial Ig domain/Protein of unknown function (DUF1214)